MHQYAAVLGHQPHVSIAELAAAVPGFTLHSVQEKQVALFSADEELDAALLDTLGGTMVLAERVTTADVSLEDVPQILAKEVSHVKKKVTFGLRTFNVPKGAIKKTYFEGKDLLKKQGRPCRYIGNERKPAATVLLRDADVLSGKKGVELFLVNTENELWVGKTIAVQDIDAYTWRDMEKPVRDTTVGLLPPKLAQVLLNLGNFAYESMQPPPPKKEAGKRKRKKKVVRTVFDPFCGTGVIPMECLLRGWHVVASDVSLKAVNGTKKNLEWIRKEKKILKKDVSEDVSKHDATKPFTLKTLPDVVVTETSLGPNLSKKPNKRDATKMRNENERLQADFLKNAAETLPGVPIVCTWPFWRLGTDRLYLEKIWNVITELGYNAVLPAEAEIEDPERLSLLYQRKDQFVGRQIVILIPKKKEE